MKLKAVLLASAMLAGLPALASAEPAESWYLGVGAGANWLDAEGDMRFVPPGVTSSVEMDFDTGWVLLGAAGYSWDGFRLEFELGYRDNDFDSLSFTSPPPLTLAATGDVRQFSQMVNMIFDIPLGDSVELSLGGGLGGVHVDLQMNAPAGGGLTFILDDDDYVFAYQAIAGLSFDVGERTEIFAEYRYFATEEPEIRGRFVDGPLVLSDLFTDLEMRNHSGLIGLRHYFGEEAAPPPPPPPPPPPTSFNVYFQKKTVLTADGHATVAEAADVLKSGASSVTIEASGLGSGTDLGERRGAAVRRALVDLGVSPDKISVTPHADGSATVTATQ